MSAAPYGALADGPIKRRIRDWAGPGATGLGALEDVGSGR